MTITGQTKPLDLGDELLIDHLYIERRMTPLNLYIRTASREQAEKAVLDLQGAKKFVPAKAEDFAIIEQVGRSTGLLK